MSLQMRGGAGRERERGLETMVVVEVRTMTSALLAVGPVDVGDFCGTSAGSKEVRAECKQNQVHWEEIHDNTELEHSCTK